MAAQTQFYNVTTMAVIVLAIVAVIGVVLGMRILRGKKRSVAAQ